MGANTEIESCKTCQEMSRLKAKNLKGKLLEYEHSKIDRRDLSAMKEAEDIKASTWDAAADKVIRVYEHVLNR